MEHGAVSYIWDVVIYIWSSGFLFFERGLNAAAGLKEVEPPFGWPRLPATTESLTIWKFNRLFTLRPLVQI